MSFLFAGCEAFDQDLNEWDVRSVTTTSSMFDGAVVFKQNIGGWQLYRVQNMNAMFRGATAFNQDSKNDSVSEWRDIRDSVSMKDMFSD
jgi:surface protein